MPKQKTVLITGVSRGIGLEFCQQLSKNNYVVIGLCRDINNADKLLALTKRFPYMKLFNADVTDPLSLEVIEDELGKKPIDIIINNAAILGNKNATLATITDEEMYSSFKTNTLAPLNIVKTFYASLLAGTDKKVVNISTCMASPASNSEGGYYSYRTSKAALNALMKSLAIDLQKDGIKVLQLHPGWVKTDMGTDAAPLTAAESVTGMIQVIEHFSGEQIAAFLDYQGKPVTW